MSGAMRGGVRGIYGVFFKTTAKPLTGIVALLSLLYSTLHSLTN